MSDPSQEGRSSPAADESAVPGTAPTKASGDDPSPVTGRILVADDVPDNQLLIELYLQETGIELVMVSNGHEALEAFRSDGPFDLVLMDMQMPEMDGYEATRAIRSLEKEEGRDRTPILSLTAHAMTGSADRSLEVGCDEHLTKPIREQQLIDAVTRYVRGAGEGTP